MGCYKIGSECCNNCVHWDCHSERKFIGNPPTEIYTSSNSDKCFLTGRNTLSKDTCGMFKHIGDITRTFAAEEKHDKGDYVKNMLDSCDETSRVYLQAMVDSMRIDPPSVSTRSVNEPAQCAECEEDDLDGEEEREFAATMKELGRANDRVKELVSEGLDYRNQLKDISVEFMHMLDRAKSGSAKDQYLFARMFLDGSHGALDESDSSTGSGLDYFRKCFKGPRRALLLSYYWCKQSAEQGYAPAEYRLGIMEKDGYNEGHNGGKWAEHDFVSALKWFMRAARHGNANAKNEYDKLKQFAFGNADRLLIQAVNCLLQNDNAKCVSLFKEASGSVIREKDSWGSEKYSEMLSDFLPDLMARTIDALTFKAEADVALAQSILGRIYVQADGFERICNEDFPKGYDWLVRAKANGDEFATEYLRTSPKVKKYEAGQKIARELDENDVASLLKAGRAFQVGNGVRSDKVKAVSYYKKAISFGSREAKYLLGECEDDSEKAKALFRDAAMKWFPTTICDSGCFDGTYNHYGTSCRNVAEDFESKNDAKNAAKWFRFAARSGSYDAAKSLGFNYLYGSSGFDVDLQKAVYWCQIASWLDDVHEHEWSKDHDVEGYLKEAKEQLDGDCEGLDELVDEDVFIDGCKGDPESQYKIGCWMYEGDLGFSEDVCAAMAWWYRAAMQGYVKAQLKIADMLFKGCDDVEKDEKEAFKWYCKAAEQNDPYAQNVVGRFYLIGCGVEKDYNAAFGWRMKSAQQGYAPAQSNVGTHYLKGMGCEQDYAKAMLWLEKADKQGNATGSAKLGFCYEKGLGCTPDSVKAVYYYKKAAEQKDSTACNNLALMYEHGNGVEKDLKKAYDLLVIAVKRGSARSYYHLGRFYENGLAVQADMAKAKEWYLKAAAKGDKDAKAALERLG